MNNASKILIIISSAVITIALVYYLLKRNKKDTTKEEKKEGILLLGGLDTRKGDKNISEQTELIKKGLNKNLDIKSFRYTDLKGIQNEIEKNPNYSVILFSKGASNSKEVALKIKEMNGDLNNLFIVEPYHSGGTATKSVREAVKLGVPEKNVFVGTYADAGLGIVPNATPTPKCSPSHWCSLTEVAKIV